MKRTTRLFVCISIFVFALFITACAAARGRLSSDVPAPCADTEGTPGQVVYAVGNKTDLPDGLEWKKIGTSESPATFEYLVNHEKVTATLCWEDADTVDLHVSNHSRRPAFTQSQRFADSWAVTDGYSAQSYLKDPKTQYGMIGFEGEAAFYIANFDDTWMVAQESNK
jgi:hypothetical protein